MKRKRLVVRVVAAIGGTCAIAFLNTPPGYIRDQFVIHPLDMGGVLIAIAAVLFILLLLGQMVVSWATRGDRTLRREGVVSCMTGVFFGSMRVHPVARVLCRACHCDWARRCRAGVAA